MQEVGSTALSPTLVRVLELLSQGRPPIMKRRLLAAPVLAALSAVASADLPTGSASLTATTRRLSANHLSASIEGAAGPAFFVVASRDKDFHQFRVLGRAALDHHGEGTYRIEIPNERTLPKNFRIHLRGAYFTRAGLQLSEPSTLLLNPTPVERLNFTWGLDGERIEPGTSLDRQWVRRGIAIEVDSFSRSIPSMAIALDSRNSRTAEQDLITPGAGPGNRRALNNLLVVAANTEDRDHDHHVDKPQASAAGGRVTFSFASPTVLDGLTLVNVDAPGSKLRCFTEDRLVGELPVPMGGTGSVQTIRFPFEAVTRLEVSLASDAAIAELTYLPCPEVIEFDRTMTGTPLDLAHGEVLRDQLAAKHAVSFSAHSNNPANEGLAVIVPRSPVPTTSEEGDQRFEHNVLVISKFNGVRSDRDFVRMPQPEPLGGYIQIDFETNVRWGSARVSDVNRGEDSFFVAEDANGNELGIFPLAALDDNVIQTVSPELRGVRRIRLHLGGTAALVGLTFCSEDQFPRLTYTPLAIHPAHNENQQ